MNWLLLVLVIVALVVASKLIHFKHAKHRVFVILIILSIAFLYFTFTTVVKNYSVDLKTASGVFNASKIYFSWIGQAFDNVKEISGNVIRMDWIPRNSSMTGSTTFGSDSNDGW